MTHGTNGREQSLPFFCGWSDNACHATANQLSERTARTAVAQNPTHNV